MGEQCTFDLPRCCVLQRGHDGPHITVVDQHVDELKRQLDTASQIIADHGKRIVEGLPKIPEMERQLELYESCKQSLAASRDNYERALDKIADLEEKLAEAKADGERLTRQAIDQARGETNAER